MSTGRQFSTSYNEIQDRIQLRARFDDAVELQLLLTRRLTRILFEAAERTALASAAGGSAREPAAQQQIAGFAREAAIENGDFSSRYVAGRPHPELAEGPLLVTGFTLRPKPAKALAMSFKLEDGKSAQFTLALKDFWGLLHVIENQAAAAGWALPKAKSVATSAAAGHA